MSAILVHGYVPKSMLKSVIIPIIKNKNKRISDKDNYVHLMYLQKWLKKYCRAYSRMDGYLQLINLGSSENIGRNVCFCSKITYNKILHKTWFVYVCGFSRCIESF